MARILISDSIDSQCADIFREEGFEVDINTGLDSAGLKAVIGNYEALVVRSSTKVTSEIINAGVHLKIIGRAGAGVDNIDVDAATRKGIIVMNTPGGNTVSTAEHTISIMLSLARKIPQADQSVKRGEWERKKFIGVELMGKTLGVLGLGKVGKEVAIRCAAFGMKVIAYDPILSSSAARELGIELVDFQYLLKCSDFISIHTPLSNETKNILNDETLAQCKRGVRIINCARGGIVNEEALLAALTAGQVGGAALDVFSQEPPGKIPLLQHPDVIATPHLGASTEEAQEKVAIQIAHQICDALKERGIAGSVNADVISSAMRPELAPYLLLAEKLGILLVQIMSEKHGALSLEVEGKLLTDSIEALCAAFLKGFLSFHLDVSLNYLNAPFIAKERGIRLEVQQGGEHSLYANYLTAGYKTREEERSISGAVFGNKNIRIVKINDFHFEINPEGHLLLYSNDDKPGIVAAVSSILAKYNVNIAGMALGRYGVGKEALTIISVDSEIPNEALNQISKINGLIDVKKAFI
ncbi:MAG: phosphoglycerate dehydrogenase [Bacteroidota bacterium]